MRWTGLIVVLGIMVAALVACEPAADRNGQAEDLNGPRNVEEQMPEVLLAVKKSDFKTAVADKVEAQLMEEGYGVVREATEDVDMETLVGYDAVVLIEAARGKVFTPEAKKIYDAMKEDTDAVVVALTTDEKRADWKPEMEGLDALTAASNMENVDDLAARIVAQTMEVIGETQ